VPPWSVIVSCHYRSSVGTVSTRTTLRSEDGDSLFDLLV
jgi:hypothetical protein